jgi:hypothetical protein
MPDPDTVPTDPVPGNPAAHWASQNPEELPARDQVIGLPRLVLETHTRLGPQATPQQVADDLKARGIDTTADAVRQCWPEGGKLSG